MNFKTLIFAFVGAGCLSACSEPPGSHTMPGTEQLTSKTSAAEQLKTADVKYTGVFLRHQPALSTMLALEEEIAGGPYNHRFPDYSEQGTAAFQQSMREASQKIGAIQTESLSESERVHQQILADIFAYYAGDEHFPGGYIDTWGGHLPYIINQISGPLIDLPKLMQVQQAVTDEAQIEAYLTRLETMGAFVDDVVAKFKADANKGIVLPKKLHPKTLAFFNSFLASDPPEHELVRSFVTKIAAIDSLSEEQRKAYQLQAIKWVTTVVYPAYNRARDAILENETIASNKDGIWSQPGGDDFYTHQIRFLGDSSLTADEIHQLGLDEVDRITALMDDILRTNGFEDGTVGERMMTLASLPGQVYPGNDEGRQALLDYLSEEINKILTKAPEFYGAMPTQAVEVRRIPPVSEAGEAGGFYSSPSLDGSRPGIYWINLRDMAAVPKFGLKTLTYHEAVPGHHFQLALNMAQKDIGIMRQNAPYNAYVEGWALYSEFVASEYMGMYDDDPLGNLGRLQAELYRAVRLVVDTGLHRKHWTREQAIDYFHKTTGTSLSDVVPEVERYMAWPGQALGYKLGMLKFIELEKRARMTLGDNYDIRELHDVMLLSGARPMSLVEKQVVHWIERQK